ncbi:hypothetical protein [Nannocystis pusilla]|uniref:Uncharacterized protein n=1 Tax=Nannocystis pusilla TaxID=889268 RepID=A0ABS7TZ03_9BACT|nr:hypothetical protein [Nannocystis pusilla]MBZ5713381.1 hypothetical protein [Nannocystis pusilla]
MEVMVRMKSMMAGVLGVIALLPAVVRAAEIYVPIVCSPVGVDSLACEPVHLSVTEVDDESWLIEVDEGDTVVLQVSDFTPPGSSTYSVSAETDYGMTSANWTKSGATATSPEETPEIEFDVMYLATSGTVVRRGGGHYHVKNAGG